MATREFNEDSYSIIKRPVRVFGTFSVGAAGAVTLQKWNYPAFGSATSYSAAQVLAAPAAGTGQWPKMAQGGAEGIFSVVRTATGLWTVKLQDSYQRLVGLQCYQSVAGGAANIVSCNENSTISNVQTQGGAVVGVSLISATGALADPTAGSLINLTFIFADSSAP